MRKVKLRKGQVICLEATLRLFTELNKAADSSSSLTTTKCFKSLTRSQLRVAPGQKQWKQTLGWAPYVVGNQGSLHELSSERKPLRNQQRILLWPRAVPSAGDHLAWPCPQLHGPCPDTIHARVATIGSPKLADIRKITCVCARTHTHTLPKLNVDIFQNYAFWSRPGVKTAYRFLPVGQV